MGQLIFSIGGHETTIAYACFTGRCPNEISFTKRLVDKAGRFSLETIMLTKEDLLELDSAPLLKNVSLELYKDFSLTYLLPRKFLYHFSDGITINVEFEEWGML